MHVVNYSSKFADVKSAMCQPNGLAVLAFFFEIDINPNPAYTEIVKKLPEITEPGSRTKITTIPLKRLLPTDLQHFYRYEGSLTTPPCNETVTWTVFKTPVQISEDQISIFRSLKSSDIDPETNTNYPLVNNVRPLQSLNDRVVYANFTTIQPVKKKSLLQRCRCFQPAD
ncbi:unnamed protein product [Candidula unifasciata]|uniref:Alpha-carbonic anhydrase domain-containing protein n=1 Tax=Candidula unifasciata TaxID=100452 RepID=A0A8S3YMV5_9EUPU|nr:unnamed protein product [Candidula unifasciata]